MRGCGRRTKAGVDEAMEAVDGRWRRGFNIDFSIILVKELNEFGFGFGFESSQTLEFRVGHNRVSSILGSLE